MASFSFVFLPLTVFAESCADLTADSAGTVVLNLRGLPLGDCQHNQPIDGVYVTSASQITNQYSFLLAFPDNDPSGASNPARTYMYSTNSSIAPISHTTTCANPGVVTTNTNVNSISLGDGDSCSLTIKGNSGTAGGEVIFTGTLARSGNIYQITSGSVCGAPHAICPPTPAGISNELQLWLKANAGTSSTTDGSSVNSWNSQINAHTAAKNSNTAPLYRTNSFNFNPTLEFDGTSTGLDLGSDYIFADATKSGVTIIAAVRPDTGSNHSSGGDFIFDFGEFGNNGYSIGHAEDGSYLSVIPGSGGYGSTVPVDGNLGTNAAIIAGVITFGTEARLYSNNTSLANGTISLTKLTTVEIDESSSPDLSVDR